MITEKQSMLQVKVEAADHSFQLLAAYGCSDPGTDCGRRAAFRGAPGAWELVHPQPPLHTLGGAEGPSSEGTAEAWAGCVQRSVIGKR